MTLNQKEWFPVDFVDFAPTMSGDDFDLNRFSEVSYVSNPEPTFDPEIPS